MEKLGNKPLIRRGIIAIAIVAIALAVAVVSRTATASAAVLLKTGSQGPQVYSLQDSLHKLGHYTGAVDGRFGPATRAAVLKFQKASGLTPDGIAGSATLQAIQRAMTTSSRSSSGRNTTVSPPNPATAAKIISVAREFLNTRYRWGGTTPAGFDCSGFVYYVLNASGIDFPRDIGSQYKSGEPVDRSALAPGDVVFFTTYAPGPSHVGIFLGNGEFIHASSAGGKVITTPLDKPYYAQRWIGGRRVIK